MSRAVTRAARRTSVLALLVTAALLPVTSLSALASTDPITGGLAAPTALTPDDSHAAFPHTVLKTVRLDWAPVSGATGYRVEIGRDGSWSDDPLFTQDVLSSELTLPVLLPHGTFLWRVAALNGATVGHWSSETGLAQSDAQFTRGWDVAPAGPAASAAAIPELHWSPVPAASAYEVQVSDQAFPAGSPTNTDTGTPPATTETTGSGTIESCVTARTRLTAFTAAPVIHGSTPPGACDPSALIAGGGTPVHWRVRALDHTLDAAIADEVAPGDSGVGSGDVNPAPDCVPDPSAECSAWTADQLVTPPAIGGGDANPVTSRVTTSSLSTDPDHLCTIVTPSSPAGLAEQALCKDVPTISWPARAAATKYRLTIALDEGLTNVQRVIETKGTRYTPTDSWAEASPATALYYVVQSCDGSGCGPVTSTPPSFRKVTPRPTLGATPPTTGEFAFTWQSYAAALAAATGQPASEDAVNYHLQLATSDHPSFDSMVDEATVDQTRYLSPSMTYPDGKYLWRVQAIDSAGHKLPWSSAQAFTRDSSRPQLVSVAPNSKVGVTAPLTLTFSEPVTGVSSSSITLSPSLPLSVTVTSSTTATLRPTGHFLPGATYRVLASSAVQDLVGNVAVPTGPAFTVNPSVDDVSPAIAFSGGWTLPSATNAIGGRYHSGVSSPTVHPSGSMTFIGTAVSLAGCLGPNNGFLDLYVDGVKRARISEYRSYSGCGLTLSNVAGLTRGQHTASWSGVGSHAPGSHSNTVTVDALGVTP